MLRAGVPAPVSVHVSEVPRLRREDRPTAASAEHDRPAVDEVAVALAPALVGGSDGAAQHEGNPNVDASTSWYTPDPATAADSA